MPSVVFNGQTFNVPAINQARGSWAPDLNTYLLALGNNALAKSGGVFTLTADANFGTNYGLVSKYFKSLTANIALSGVIRLANNEGIGTRNAANSADVVLKVNASDRLEIDGVVIPTISSTDTLTNKSIAAGSNTITGLTKSDVGLDQVDNTSDATKNAAVATLTNKTLTSPVINSPTGIVKGDVGLGNVDNTSDATKNAASATLTNKTLASPAVTGAIDFTQTTTPSTPASGHNKIYFKADGKAYTLDQNGLEKQVGSGAGGGFKNYIANPDDANAGWATSSPNIGVTTESTAANLPDNATKTTGVKVLRSSGTTNYVYTRFTLDAADYSKKMQILWDQAYAGTAGDYKVEIWSNTASNYGGTSTQLTTPVTSIPAATGSFNTTFDSPNSAAPYLELRIIGAAGTTPLYLNNVTVTPGQPSQGAAVSGRIYFTPGLSASFGSVTVNTAWYVRNGDRMIGKVSVKVGGTLTTATPTFTIPDGYNVDFNAQKDNKSKLGFGSVSNSGGGASVFASGVGFVLSTAGNSTQLTFNYTNGTDASNTTYTQVTNTQSLLNPNGNMTFDFDIPIAEWAGNGTVNLGPGAQVEYASNSSTSTTTSDTTSFSATPGQIQSITTALSRRVRFQYPLQGDDCLMVQVSADGVVWSDCDGVSVVPKGGPAGVVPFTVQGTNTYGIGRPEPVVGTTTDVTIQFGKTAYTNNTTYGNDGQAWSAGANQYYWRVKKYKASAPVGFGIATNTTSGLTVTPKQYVVGTAYANGTPTVAVGSAGPAVSGSVRGVLVPYQTYEGAWRLKFNLVIPFASTSSYGGGSGINYTISGTTFKNVSNYLQPISAFMFNATVGKVLSYAEANTARMWVAYTANVTSCTGVAYSGDVELDSKPTWAD